MSSSFTESEAHTWAKPNMMLGFFATFFLPFSYEGPTHTGHSLSAARTMPTIVSDNTGFPAIMQVMVYGVFLSAVGWCAVVALAVHAFRVKFKEQDTYSPKIRVFLLCYVVAMAGISTIALISSLVYADGLMHRSSYEDIGQPVLFYVGHRDYAYVPLSLAIFGADTLMAWRCYVLYQGICRPRFIFVKGLIIFIWIISLGSTFLSLTNVLRNSFNYIAIYIFTTIPINIVLAVLITSRLLSHSRQMQRILGVPSGGDTSPFRHVVAMCVESCALIIVGSVICGTIAAANVDLSDASLPFLAHICVFSPLMLVVRVAKGHAYSTTAPTLSNQEMERNATIGRRRSPIQFVAAISVTDLEPAITE